MRGKLSMLVVIGLSMALVAACGMFGGDEAEETPAEQPATENTPAEQPAEPAKAPAEAPPAAGGGGGAGCDGYLKCCNAYAEAMGKVPALAGAVEGQKQACSQIEQLKASPGGDTACQSALDSMKQAGAAYKQMPGFTWPAECN